MEIVLPVVISIGILMAVFLVLSRVRTPYYRVDHAAVEQFLTLVLTGQASEWDWSVFTSIPIQHEPQLEAIRLRCVELEQEHYLGDTRRGFLLSPEGLACIKALLLELKGEKPEHPIESNPQI